jgi:D-alanyl-lipoteichoic acid acyltransferase DltB (MBOAT superfamily)
MLFNSFEFVFFFAAVIVVYYSLPYRYRVWFLLAASYYFYMRWNWEYIFLILAQTAINYEIARLIVRSENATIRRAWLAFALVLSLGMLGFFKYFNFFNDNARLLFESAGLSYLVPHLDILLPVGISFYTFQTLSYTIDVYRRQHRVERHLGRFALYVAFFPQLVAGPIERATHLLDQFKRKNNFDIQRFSDGMKLILWGMFKKVVIADRLAVYVNAVYGSPEIHSGSTLLLATYFFTFQIYCDFSGYSDIAIGSAKVLGYDLMQNFRLPYLSRSISEFWKRWHISLTTWFVTYLYIPLGGNRVSYGRWIFNILIVFLVSGLWHGANWTFIVWGALHASYYFVESLVRRIKERFGIPRLLPVIPGLIIQIIVTFHLVVLAWVFFRANSVSDAALITKRIFSDIGGTLYMGSSQLTTLLSISLIFVLVVVQIAQATGFASFYFSRSRFPAYIRWPGYIGALFGISLLGVSSNAFIYFQF